MTQAQDTAKLMTTKELIEWLNEPPGVLTPAELEAIQEELRRRE